MRQILLLLVACSIAAGVMAADLNKTDKKGRKQGEWVKTYQNGHVQYKGHFVDDKPTGTFYRYYETGKLQSVQVYDAGNTSDVTFYDPDGQTVSTVGHFDGKVKITVQEFSQTRMANVTVEKEFQPDFSNPYFWAPFVLIDGI